MLKKILKSVSIIYLIIGILVGSSGYYFVFKKSSNNIQNTASQTFEIVGTGSIKETIDAVGTAQLVDEQSLKFNKVGTITKVNYKAGDKIKKGDVIAQIDDSDGENSVKDAQISLDNAKLSFSSLYDNVKDSQLLQSQNTISNTTNSLSTAQAELENLKQTQNNSLENLQKNIDNLEKDYTNALSSYELAQKDLDLTKQNQDKSYENSSSNRTNSIKQIEDNFSLDLTTISKMIEQVDYILGVTDANKTKNDSFEIYLSAKNSTYKSQAEASLLKSISLYEDTQKLVSSYDYSLDTQKIKTILDSFSKVYTELTSTTDLTYKSLENTVESTTLTSSDIDSKKTNIYNYKSNVLSKLASINSSINTLNTLTDLDLLKISNQNTISSKEQSLADTKNSLDKKLQDIDKAKKDLETTKKSYDIELNSKLQNIENIKKTLEINNKSYTELIDGPTDEEIQKAKNAISQAEIKLKTAKESLDDYKIIAPFDGIIRKIDYMVGDNITADTEKYIYVENHNMLEIKVMLDQVDIAKVSIGTKAIITFDAYSSQKVNAVISSIDTTPVSTSGVVSYTVKLVLDDKNFDKKVLSGMTANVEIISKEDNNAILVSTQAITTSDDKSYVTIFNRGQTKKQEVTTGMVSSGKTQILTGLSVGDRIVIENYTKTTPTKTTSTSLFGPSSNKSSNNSSSRSFGGGIGGGMPPGGF